MGGSRSRCLCWSDRTNPSPLRCSCSRHWSALRSRKADAGYSFNSGCLRAGGPQPLARLISWFDSKPTVAPDAARGSGATVGCGCEPLTGEPGEGTGPTSPESAEVFAHGRSQAIEPIANRRYGRLPVGATTDQFDRCGMETRATATERIAATFPPACAAGQPPSPGLQARMNLFEVRGEAGETRIGPRPSSGSAKPGRFAAPGHNLSEVDWVV